MHAFHEKFVEMEHIYNFVAHFLIMFADSSSDEVSNTRDIINKDKLDLRVLDIEETAEYPVFLRRL